MTIDIISAIASACTLGACLYGLYRALAPIVTIEKDKHDDLES
jgi:hypothetical protein